MRLFVYVLIEKERNEFKNVVRYAKHLMSLSFFTKYFGENLPLLSKSYPTISEEQFKSFEEFETKLAEANCKGKKSKGKGGKGDAGNNKNSKKEAAPKNQKKETKKEEVKKPAAPAKKQGRDVPASEMNLDMVKKEVINANR